MLLALGCHGVVAARAALAARASALERARRRASAVARVARGRGAGQLGYDPGRERRAEQRARELLRSCVDERSGRCTATSASCASGVRLGDHGRRARGAPYAYLIYPHKPIVAYVPQTRRLLNEYCVAFPDHAALRQPAAARLRRRAREVDGADRRRARADRRGEHAPARTPGRPRRGARATSRASRAGSASAPRAHRRSPPSDGR